MRFESDDSLWLRKLTKDTYRFRERSCRFARSLFLDRATVSSDSRRAASESNAWPASCSSADLHVMHRKTRAFFGKTLSGTITCLTIKASSTIQMCSEQSAAEQ